MTTVPIDLPPTLQIPEHRQMIEHRQELRVTNTGDIPLDVALRLNALRIAVESVAVLYRDRYFAVDDKDRPGPAQLLDEAFAQADRVLGYYQTGQWEPVPIPATA
jgi:hypothetical protein